MSFPNGSSAGLDGISPQNFEKFDCQVERANWTEFSQSPNKSCECDSQRKSTYRTSPYVFGAKLIALKKPDGGLRPIAVGNTFCSARKHKQVYW